MKKIQLLFLFAILSIAGNAQHTYQEATISEVFQEMKKGAKDFIVLDVRTSGEYEDTVSGGRKMGIGRIKNAINIPIQEILQKPEAIKKLEPYKNSRIYVICSHSYRSRRVSNHLLANGFTHVTNVKGGMTELYRDYEKVKDQAAGYFENNIPYKNISPAQLYRKLESGEGVQVIGFSNPPRFFFDSLITPLYQYFPSILNIQYHKPADSLEILEKVKAANGKAFVFYNTVGGGAAETAYWLAQKGYPNSYHLVGNLPAFFEYMVNYQPSAFNKIMPAKSKVEFLTPLSYCKKPKTDLVIVDMRHDTTFNKITNGTKLTYKTLKGAVNFPFYKTVDEFEKAFPDKGGTYLLLPEQGYAGIDLANSLANRGYHIKWIWGGIERWEWYTNNIPEFTCGNMFTL
jgi:rhodanese-related sulfurtransferase